MSERLADAIRAAAPLSDTAPEYLTVLADYVIAAHTAAPGGCTIEIGTRMGGAAAVMAVAMLDVYGKAESCPPLLTCDPYGCRPYNDGRGTHETGYGRDKYVAMKQLLAGIPNHAHFRLPSRDFLRMLSRWEWWEDGKATPFRNVTFAFLDGEHDADSIEYEARTVLEGLLPGGIIIADNVDHDPLTVPRLRALGEVALQGPWAILRRRGDEVDAGNIRQLG